MTANNITYIPRHADKLLEEKLQEVGAVIIKGPKWCGKTSTAANRAASVLYMQDPDALANNLMLANEKPSVLLQGKKPRLIDEWQEAPQLMDAVRFAIDKQQLLGAFILTGSATPKAEPRHSGVGRVGFVQMRTMTLAETGESCKAVSLSRLLSNGSNEYASNKTETAVCEAPSNLDIESIAEIIVRGSWPVAVARGVKNVAVDYVQALVNTDIQSCETVGRNPITALEILREYARCTSTQSGVSTMSKNLKERGGEISRPTFNSYLSSFRKLNIIDDLPAWRPSLKSKARTTSTPKRFLCDTSLACAAMQIKNNMLLNDLSTMGHLFENMCVHDIKAYCETFGAQAYFYRDTTGLEADCVVVDAQGRWGLIEIKLATSEVEAGAKSLNEVSNKIDKTLIGEPAFLMVITGSGYSYIRSDGIVVCPIGCLAP